MFRDTYVVIRVLVWGEGGGTWKRKEKKKKKEPKLEKKAKKSACQWVIIVRLFPQKTLGGVSSMYICRELFSDSLTCATILFCIYTIIPKKKDKKKRKKKSTTKQEPDIILMILYTNNLIGRIAMIANCRL